MILYLFYKNVLIGFTLFWYNIFAFHSGQTIYDDFALTLYNVIFTSVPPVLVGVMDVDASLDSGIRQARERGCLLKLEVILHRHIYICSNE